MEIADKRGEGCHVQEYKYKSWDLVLTNICTPPSFSELSQERFCVPVYTSYWEKHKVEINWNDVKQWNVSNYKYKCGFSPIWPSAAQNKVLERLVGQNII